MSSPVPAINWSSFDPGGKHYNKKYSPREIRALYAFVLDELLAEPDARLWKPEVLEHCSTLFGLPGQEKAATSEGRGYLLCCRVTLSFYSHSGSSGSPSLR